jgi:biotin carboxylase
VEGVSAEQGSSRLLVLGAGPAQLGLLAAARERGLFVIAADRDPSALGFRYADRRAIVSAEDEHAIERLAGSEAVDGIVAPGIDWPVGIAARVAERLGLPHPVDPAAAALATSKLGQRERFAERGVPQPRFTRANGPHNPLGYPCVVKAPDRQGQRGLSYVARPADLVDAVRAALQVSRSGVALIEEAIEGPEVTVNAFSVDGVFTPLTVTERRTADQPAFGVALAHVWSGLEPGLDAADVARRAAEALGIRNGPTYTQLRLADDRPRVIELAARLGGGHDAELCRAATGVDLNALAIAAALGEQVEPPRPEALVGGACVRFLVAPPGELLEVTGVDEARAATGVLDVHVYRPPGALGGPLRTGADRAGAVLAAGNSGAEAVARADAAAALIRFRTTGAEAFQRA